MKLPEYDSLQEKESHFSHIAIDTKESFDTYFDNLRNNGLHYIFRGVNEAKYKLYTSVQREWITNELGQHTTINDLVSTLIKKIRKEPILNRYYQSLNICQTDLLYLSLLQHYSAPTPLLDFSHDLNVALYFATRNVHVGTTNNAIDDYLSLYYINLDKCGNELTKMDDFLINGLERGQKLYEEYSKNNPSFCIDKSLLDDIDELTQWYNPKNSGGSICNISLAFIDNPVKSQQVVTPYTQNTLYWSNLNIMAQQGCFLLYNNKDEPIETYIGSLQHRFQIHCMDIHKSLTTYIKANYLSALSDDVLFPDISQMAKSAYTYFKERL